MSEDDLIDELQDADKQVEKLENKVKDLTDVLNRCTEEKDNYYMLCKSQAQEIAELKKEKIKLETRLNKVLEEYRNKGEL